MFSFISQTKPQGNAKVLLLQPPHKNSKIYTKKKEGKKKTHEFCNFSAWYKQTPNGIFVAKYLIFIDQNVDDSDDDEDCGVEDEEEFGDGQNWAYFTFDTLAKTSKGVKSPIMVTFFVVKSTLYEVTPAWSSTLFS